MLERYLHRRGSEIGPIQVVGVPLLIYGNLFAGLRQKISDTLLLIWETFFGLPRAFHVPIPFYPIGNATIFKCINSQTVLIKIENRPILGHKESFVNQ